MAEGSGGSETAALLTNRQREVLRGNQSVEDGAKWSMHSRIRKRLRRTILDLTLVYDHWDEMNLGQVFDDEQPADELAALATGVQYGIALFYRGMFGTQTPFERLVAQGCHRAERDENNRSVGFALKTEQHGELRTAIEDAARDVEEGNIDAVPPGMRDTLLEVLSESDVELEASAAEGRDRLFDLNEDDEE